MTKIFKGKLFKAVLGIEFKDDSFVIACFKHNLSGITLLSSATFPLKEDAETVALVKGFIDKNKAGKGKVFVSIPHKWAIVKFVEIPLPPGKGSIRGLINYEIGRHIPFQTEDVFYDFSIMEKKNGSCEVALVAVPKEKIEYVKRFLEAFSLKPQGITISSFAVLNAVMAGVAGGRMLGITKRYAAFGHKGDISVLLFLNKDESLLTIIKNPLCLYLKTFVFDPNAPTEVFLEAITPLIKESLSRVSLQKMDRLILSGDIPSSPQFLDALGERFGVKPVVINPLSMFFSGKAEGMQWLASAIGTSLSGLGLVRLGQIKINLMSSESGREAKEISPLITKVSTLLIIFLCAGILTGGVIKEKRFSTEIEEALKKNEVEVKAVESLSTNLKELVTRRDLLLNIKKSDIALNILLELTNIIPQDSWITNLSYKESGDKGDKVLTGELVISGYAVSSSKLISILEDSPIFEKVEFVGAITKTGGKEGFKIKAVVALSEKLKVKL